MCICQAWSLTLMIIESKFITSINSCLERFTVFSWKIFKRCLTFDAVYITFRLPVSSGAYFANSLDPDQARKQVRFCFLSKLFDTLYSILIK